MLSVGAQSWCGVVMFTALTVGQSYRPAVCLAAWSNGRATSKPCILVAGEDVQLMALVRRTLDGANCLVSTASSDEAAFAAIEQRQPDLVILGAVMPGTDACAAYRHIRSLCNVPIVLLQAKGGEEEQIRGLDCGADDYLTTPFSVEILLARVRSVLRRSQAALPTLACDVFESGSLKIDFVARQVVVGGEEVKLTPTEFHVLHELVHNVGKVITHSQLLREVWGPEYREETQYLHVFVGCLRTKLKLKNKDHGAIDNTAGVGYRFISRDFSSDSNTEGAR